MPGDWHMPKEEGVSKDGGEEVSVRAKLEEDWWMTFSGLGGWDTDLHLRNGGRGERAGFKVPKKSHKMDYGALAGKLVATWVGVSASLFFTALKLCDADSKLQGRPSMWATA
eukprot:s627_g5.t1